MTDLDHEVQAALEADGHEVESVRAQDGPPDTHLRRSATPYVYEAVVWLALRISDELSDEAIRAALAKVKEIVLRRRREGDEAARETKSSASGYLTARAAGTCPTLNRSTKSEAYEKGGSSPPRSIVSGVRYAAD